MRRRVLERASVLLIGIAGIGSQCSAADTFTVSRSESITTQYLLLGLKEFRFDDDRRKSFSTGAVGGGAFVAVGDSLVYATSNGKFLGIDLANANATSHLLPDLDLGTKEFKQSKRITYFETLPRVHDITEADGTFYVSYDRFHKETDRISFEISSFQRGESTWRVLYRSPPLDVDFYTLGNGGTLQLRGRTLYFTVGDYALDRILNTPTDQAAQNRTLPWGKVLALDLDTRAVSIVSIGHRNTLGLLFLRDQRLLASEQGPRGGDKLIFIERGKNYGWPIVSGGTAYGSYRTIGTRSLAASYEPPFFEFVPSVAPTQIAEAAGFSPLWDGDILMGSLKAETLFRIRIASNHVVHVEPIEVGERIRDIKQIGKKIVLLTDNYSFIVLEPNNDAESVRRSVAVNGALHLCGSCHSFSTSNKEAFAPTLENVLGRPIASTDYRKYSLGLRAAGTGGRRWDADSIAAFVRDPDTFAKGTTMPNFHVSERDIENVVSAITSSRK